MSPADRVALLRLADALPAGSQVFVPRDWLLALLTVPDAALVPADATLADLAQRFGRSIARVRQWVERGDFPGAYRFQAREWRVPWASVAAFEERQRQQPSAGSESSASSTVPSGDSTADRVDLGTWRHAS